ncbi:hypothetical protein GW17_00035737 [Ensete ventricosum]|nr:hypothetical protein GW17_00035737 [Ensete ventricosum]
MVVRMVTGIEVMMVQSSMEPVVEELHRANVEETDEDRSSVEAFVDYAVLAVGSLHPGQSDPELGVQQPHQQSWEDEEVEHVPLLWLSCHELVYAVRQPWSQEHVLQRKKKKKKKKRRRRNTRGSPNHVVSER